MKGQGTSRNESTRRHTHLGHSVWLGCIAGPDGSGASWRLADFISPRLPLDQDRAKRLATAQQGICRVLYWLSSDRAPLLRARSIAHNRRKSYVPARRAECMAYAPPRSDLDRNGWHGLDSAMGRSDRGDSKGRCYLDSSGSETLARRYAKYSDDAPCNTGTAQWQSCGVDGKGDRRAIPQMIVALTRNYRRSR